MDIQQILALLVVIILIATALYFKTIRKTVGLLLVILGGLACITIVGLILGIPMIIIGGIFLFIGKK